MPLALVAFLVAYVLERGFELWRSARNVGRLRARGAVEHGAGHFPLLVVVHTLFPIALMLEVMGWGARPPATWPEWLMLWVGAQVLRYAAVRALGERWNVRILVVPGLPLVRRGPYRYLKHPNYVAVAVELLSAPMMFGAWRTAVAISFLNAVALTIRVRAEERALRSATSPTA
jgi:methyltransferase